MFEDKIKEAIKVLKKGGAVVYPTDTAYGLGVNALNSEAVQNLYMIKERENHKPTHIVVSDIEMAKEYVVVSPFAEKIMGKFLPGPISVVLPLKEDSSESLKQLSANSGSLGIRIPKDEVAISLVRAAGFPITTPSANITDGETPYKIETSKKQFETKMYQPDYYLDVGELPLKKPSTIVRIVGNDIELLREGAIEFDTIKDIL